MQINFDNARELAQADILELGEMAHRHKLAQVGPRVFYSINRHLNYTNICRIGCKFCHFHRPIEEKGGYALTVDEVLVRAAAAVNEGASELHIVGGVNPDLPFSYFLELIGQLRRHFPGLHLKAFTATEIIDLAQKAQLAIEQVLGRLIEAGLGSLPGGGAEILDEEYFRRHCPNKPGPHAWLEVHATAHRLGLMTNATMLFGNGESLEQRLRHLEQIRELQDRSLAAGKGHFQCFVPLPFISRESRVASQSIADCGLRIADSSNPKSKIQNLKSNPPASFDELRTIALCRMVLDNVPHVKAFWPMLGIKLAQVALAWGADDLDGTVGEYHVVESENAVSEDRIRSLILETGQEPMKRINGTYPR